MEDQYLIDKNRYDGDVKNGIFPEKTLIEKQVWESTLHRSMVLEAENIKLKELLRKAKGIITAYRLTGNQSTYSNNDMKECVAQIEQALGEDK